MSARGVVWLDRLLQLAAGALVIVLLGTVVAGIVSRALNQPLSWTDEASGFLMVWLACLGWMIATRQSAHPADAAHPYGHARVETAATLALGTSLALIGRVTLATLDSAAAGGTR